MESVHSFLAERLRGAQKLAILGAGSVLKADDAAGVLVIEALDAFFTPQTHPNILLCAGETAPENFTGKIVRFRPDHLLLIDAADVGRAPGDIVEIRPQDVGGPTFCSHMLPLRVMTDYIVSETGAAVTLLGIQPRSIAFDGPVSEEVRGTIDEICGALRRICAN